MSQLIDNLNTIESIKTDIKAAIENKGVDMTGVSFPGYASKIGEISVSAEKPEESLEKTITSNGSFHYNPSAGSVFSNADITVDVHPSESLSKTYTTNGTKTITGEFNGGSITINVHPTAKLSKTYTKNGTYNVSGEWKDAAIKVNVPSTLTVTMTQAQYNALTVKDSNTIYLIKG